MLLSGVDEWWNLIDEYEQLRIFTSLREIHAGLPVMVIATYNPRLENVARMFESTS